MPPRRTTSRGEEETPSPLPPSRLKAPPPAAGRPVALYDGRCRFCTTQAEKLGRMARGALDLRDFQQPGALDPFPGVTHEDCMRALQLIDRDGTVYSAAEAVVRALRLGRPLLGRLALVYYVPGLRQLSEWGYALVARNRYRLFGKTRPACDEGGTCSLHFPKS